VNFYYIILQLNGLKLNTSTALHTITNLVSVIINGFLLGRQRLPMAKYGHQWTGVFGMVDTLPEAKPTAPSNSI